VGDSEEEEERKQEEEERKQEQRREERQQRQQRRREREACLETVEGIKDREYTRALRSVGRLMCIYPLEKVRNG
jgi:hypothetical protein